MRTDHDTPEGRDPPSNPSSKPKRPRRRMAETPWQVVKTILCLLQFYALSVSAANAALSFSATTADSRQKYLSLLALVPAVALFIAIWKYYDNIDDWGFAWYCEPDISVPLFHTSAWRWNAALTILGATPVLVSMSRWALGAFFPRMPAAASWGISTVLPLAFVVIWTIVRIKDLDYTWSVQKTLRTPKDRRYGVLWRVGMAILFFVAMVIFVPVVVRAVIPAVLTLTITAFKLLTIPLSLAVTVLVTWQVIRWIRRILDRHRFLRRLKRLKEAGELTYTIHGHPYLSLFFYRYQFGLTLVDRPHPDGHVKTDTAYCVAVADCRRRRGMINLCDDQIYQYVHSIRLRTFGMAVMGGTRVFSVPVATWYSNHTFRFPQGEGKRILLVDPAPHILCIHGDRPHALVELDNSSQVFGYTVYGKNSFLNLLERI